MESILRTNGVRWFAVVGWILRCSISRANAKLFTLLPPYLYSRTGCGLIEGQQCGTARVKKQTIHKIRKQKPIAEHRPEGHRTPPRLGDVVCLCVVMFATVEIGPDGACWWGWEGTGDRIVIYFPLLDNLTRHSLLLSSWHTPPFVPELVCLVYQNPFCRPVALSLHHCPVYLAWSDACDLHHTLGRVGLEDWTVRDSEHESIKDCFCKLIFAPRFT